jgi:hypothetical protein
VSTPPPTPSFDDRVRRANRLTALAVLAVVLLGVIAWFGYRALKPQGYPPDDSVVRDKEWRTLHGHTVENGRVYDQATVDLAGVTELVLPTDRERQVSEEIDITLHTDGEARVLRVLLEKQRQFFGHPPESIRLLTIRESKKLWKRQVGTVLTLDADSGVGTIEGGTRVRVVFIVPPNFPVRQMPVSSAPFAGRYEEGRRAGADKSKAAGWEEVPQKPLPKSQWPLPSD